MDVSHGWTITICLLNPLSPSFLLLHSGARTTSATKSRSHPSLASCSMTQKDLNPALRRKLGKQC